MTGPYNPRWQSKKPKAGGGDFESILGKTKKTKGKSFVPPKEGPLYGTHFINSDPGHETTTEIREDVARGLSELYAEEIRKSMDPGIYSKYMNTASSTKEATADEIIEKMREARDWSREYEGHWDAVDPIPRGRRNRNPGNVLEGEFIPAKRKTYEPASRYRSTHRVANGKCYISYRGSTLSLSDDERKTRSKDALVGTIATFCKLIDQQKDIIP